MASHDSYVPPTWQLEGDLAGVTRRIPSSAFYPLPSQSGPGSGSHCHPSSSYPAPANEGNFTAVAAQDYPWIFLEPDQALVSNASSALADLAPGHGPSISSALDYELGSVVTEFPAMNAIHQTSDEAPRSFASETFFNPLPISHTMNPSLPAPSLNQHLEARFQSAVEVDPNTLATLDIPHPGWGVNQFGAGFSRADPPSSSLVEPAVWIDGSSYEQNSQMVYLEPEPVVQSPLSANIPLEEQIALFAEPIYRCGWRDESGAVCGEIISRASLPGHLSEHGIKDKCRNHPTKCSWVGCKKKKTMNRESIVRHIREVHMRLRRPPTKRVTGQASVLKAPGRRTKTI